MNKIQIRNAIAELFETICSDSINNESEGGVAWSCYDKIDGYRELHGYSDRNDLLFYDDIHEVVKIPIDKCDMSTLIIDLGDQKFKVYVEEISE